MYLKSFEMDHRFHRWPFKTFSIYPCAQSLWKFLSPRQHVPIALYGTAQFELNIYTRVTQEFLDKFLIPLTSFTRANHWNIHLHVCHCRVARQIYLVTRKLHARSEQICRATHVLHASAEQICWATHELYVSKWSDELMRCATHEEHIMLHVKCMHGHSTSESGFN